MELKQAIAITSEIIDFFRGLEPPPAFKRVHEALKVADGIDSKIAQGKDELVGLSEKIEATKERLKESENALKEKRDSHRSEITSINKDIETEKAKTLKKYDDQISVKDTELTQKERRCKDLDLQIKNKVNQKIDLTNSIESLKKTFADASSKVAAI